jgi:hypothetical protein
MEHSTQKLFHLHKSKKLSLCLISYALCDEDVWGSEGIAPPFLTSALDGSGELHTPAALPLGEEPPQYPLNKRLSGPQSRSGRCGEQKNHALPGIEPGPSSPSLISPLYFVKYSPYLEVFQTNAVDRNMIWIMHPLSVRLTIL